MFKDTKDFFNKLQTVCTDAVNVTEIDKQNYIYKITSQHNIDKLYTLRDDLIEHITILEWNFEDNLTRLDIIEKAKYWEEIGKKLPLWSDDYYYNDYDDFKKELESFPEKAKEKLFGYIGNDIHVNVNLLFAEEIKDDRGYLNELEVYINQLINKHTNINTKHDNVFANNGFILFEHILTEYVAKNRGRQSDISYYYHRMFNDKYIHQKPFSFSRWYSDIYDKDISKLKTLEQVKNQNRYNNYSTALAWFKHQL